MQYVVWGAPQFPPGLGRETALEPLAAGEPLVLEGPWGFGSSALGFLADDAALMDLATHAATTSGAFAVEALQPPGEGGAFVIAAHKMIDSQGFRPYAEAIPEMLHNFGVRSLARGGTVTPLAGDFVPDRGVVLEFADVEAVIDFYTSDVYAPLLRLRLQTTDPRFVVLSRAGTISAAIRTRAQQFVQAMARERASGPFTA